MKYFILSLALALLPFSSLMAQEDIDPYDYQSEDLQRIFCDYAKDCCEVKYISSSDGQYVGNTKDGILYGWGYFLANDGRQIVGQFRNGKSLFGITMTANAAIVGGEKHYITYDLESGNAVKVVNIDGTVPYTSAQLAPYQFKKITYTNGDCYYGELMNGKRHGYGLYYWTNGDFWYGKYVNGYRQGFGVLFKSDNHIFYGKWLADEKVE